jgi:hypothetical protein
VTDKEQDEEDLALGPRLRLPAPPSRHAPSPLRPPAQPARRGGRGGRGAGRGAGRKPAK